MLEVFDKVRCSTELKKVTNDWKLWQCGFGDKWRG